MTDLVTRMRCQAGDLHVLNPTSETVKCLSLGADELENALRRAEYWKAEHNAANAELTRLRDENEALKNAWLSPDAYQALMDERTETLKEMTTLREALEQIGDTACGEASHQYIALKALAAMREGK